MQFHFTCNFILTTRYFQNELFLFAYFMEFYNLPVIIPIGLSFIHSYAKWFSESFEQDLIAPMLAQMFWYRYYDWGGWLIGISLFCKYDTFWIIGNVVSSSRIGFRGVIRRHFFFLQSSVSDPHRFYADPDPAFLLNADPDPDLDPDPTCRI
jgi:hypothetical protein